MFDKQQWIRRMKEEFGEFDEFFYIKENIYGDVITVVCRHRGMRTLDLICECKTIKHLDVSNNRLENVLPLFTMNTIRTLDLSHNELRNLYGVGSNRKLVRMVASYNNINCISDGLTFMKSFEEYQQLFN